MARIQETHETASSSCASRRTGITRFVAAFVIFGLGLQATAAELTGYVVLSSDYVQRGVSYSDDDPVLQLGGDVLFQSGFFLGAWGSTLDVAGNNGSQRDFEVRYYVGYGHELADDWAIAANAVLYTYPGSGGSFDYDYEEYSLALNFRDRYWLDYAVAPDFYGTGRSTWSLAMLGEWPLPNKFRLSAGIGHHDLSDLSGSTYRYWQFGISRLINRIDLDLRYHGASDWVPVFSTAERTDDRVVLGIRLQF